MAISLQYHEDLSPYYADLDQLPGLSSEEEATLLARLRLAQQGLLAPEQAQAAKQRLIEGYLPRIMPVARKQQSYFHRLSLADLIQEGNLALLQAVEDFDFTQAQGCFFAYATTCLRNALVRLLSRDGLLSIHRLQFWKLRRLGRLKEWDRAQPLSLDQTDKNDEHSFYETLPASSPATSVTSDAVRQHVQTLLARLMPREQMMLRLCYGLDETDGRTLDRREIAVLLGITPGAVKKVLQRAMHRLRTAPEEHERRAAQRQRKAEQQIRREAERRTARVAREARLEEAYARLEARGSAITMLSLAQEAQVGTSFANIYLCQRWGTIQQRLQRAYAELMPTGAVITVERLAKTARVGERAASDFLHEQRGTMRQPRPRKKGMQASNTEEK